MSGTATLETDSVTEESWGTPWEIENETALADTLVAESRPQTGTYLLHLDIGCGKSAVLEMSVERDGEFFFAELPRFELWSEGETEAEAIESLVYLIAHEAHTLLAMEDSALDAFALEAKREYRRIFA